VQIPRLPDHPVRPAVPWTLEHLRTGFIVTLGLAVIGIPLAWWLRGGGGALGVLIGLAIVAAFFAVSAWAVARAGRIDDRLTLPAALGTYVIKIGLLGLVVISMPTDGYVNVKAMAIAVVAGTICWSIAQVWYVWHKQIYYVDYHQ
jgi:hypothetical protein